MPTNTSRFPLVAYIIHHTHSLACSHAAHWTDSKFPATHSPPVCIFLYDEYIYYEKCHINSNESTSKCHFHIAKQFTNS